MRKLLRDLPWEELQRQHDSGKTIRELCVDNRVGGNSIRKAVKLGLMKTRDSSAALRIAHKKNPRDYSKARESKTDLQCYRLDCSFKFNLGDYPNEFDFSLVEEHGWYKAKNRGDNQNGVSRDHAVSVRFGFDNGLPAYHLAHPANCVLMRHKANVSKGRKNLFAYDELLERISAWDAKYT